MRKILLMPFILLAIALAYISYRVTPHLDWEYLTHEESPGMWDLIDAEFGSALAMLKIGNFYYINSLSAASWGDGDWCSRLDKAYYWFERSPSVPEFEDYVTGVLTSKSETKKSYLYLEDIRREQDPSYQSRCVPEEVKSNA